MTRRSYCAKKCTFGCKIKYQLRMQRYIEWGVTDKETVKVSGVKPGPRFKKLYYNIEKPEDQWS